MSKARRGILKDKTEDLIMALDNEIIEREKELDSLKRERKLMQGKMDEEERR